MAKAMSYSQAVSLRACTVEDLSAVSAGSRSDENHPLSDPYVIWVSRRVACSKFQTFLAEVGSFDTVELMWAVYSHMRRPSEKMQHNIFVFIQGTKPLWEENPEGGHWRLSLNKGLVDRCWEELIFALVGNQFPVKHQEILGISVKIRKDVDVVTVWNKTASSVEIVDKIGVFLRYLLQLPSHIGIIYRRNRKCLQETITYHGQCWYPGNTKEKVREVRRTRKSQP